MSNTIQLAIDTPTLERLIREQQIKLEEIHCADCASHRKIQRLLLNTLKSGMSDNS